MAQSIEESLLKAIKKDDIKAFNALTEKAQCGAYRLGRFPVLSLMYLYKSRRLISANEGRLLKVTDYSELREPVEVSKKFSAKAGKCLRLYFGEVVTPVEMLLILDETKRLKRVYPLAKPSEEVRNRLKSIYSVRYSLSVKFEGDNIILDRRPLSYREKKNIATLCLSAVLVVTVAVGVPTTCVALIPKRAEGEVTKLSHIDFNSDREYTLKRDLVIPENYSVEKVNCKIIGEGNKLIFGKGATLGELDGTMSDVTIESSGAVFTSVSENAKIQNVTVNVNAELTSAASAALVAETNFGTIEGVTVNVSGKITALAPSENGGELTFGGIVLSNSYRYIPSTQTVYRGTIKNCTVNYSQLSLAGEAVANAAFGGVAGSNSGYLLNCTVTGEITSDTFDVAGVCTVNNGMLSGNVNEADISQVSADTGWNPISCGIVLSNTYAIENCENKGKISAVSSCGQFDLSEGNEPAVSAAGIAYLNRGSSTSPYIKNCINSGAIESRAEHRNAYASGVCLSSSGEIGSCKNSGAVAAQTGGGFEIYAGGITAIAYGEIYKSVNEGALSATGDGAAYIGGITAHSFTMVSYCLSDGEVSIAANEVYAGGILGFSAITTYGRYVYCGMVDHCISKSTINIIQSDKNTQPYVGGIVGYVNEAWLGGAYFGGGVSYSCFVGECLAEGAYIGNIVGVCGANTYEKDSYDNGYKIFEENRYVENSFSAFGRIVSEGEFAIAEDKGATSAAIDDIQNSEVYKSILNEIEK